MNRSQRPRMRQAFYGRLRSLPAAPCLTKAYSFRSMQAADSDTGSSYRCSCIAGCYRSICRCCNPAPPWPWPGTSRPSRPRVFRIRRSFGKARRWLPRQRRCSSSSRNEGHPGRSKTHSDSCLRCCPICKPWYRRRWQHSHRRPCPEGESCRFRSSCRPRIGTGLACPRIDLAPRRAAPQHGFHRWSQR